ncbi:MAG: hypothetical protein Q9226_009125 [Calogaya cf. arnoldii]
MDIVMELMELEPNMNDPDSYCHKIERFRNQLILMQAGELLTPDVLCQGMILGKLRKIPELTSFILQQQAAWTFSNTDLMATVESILFYSDSCCYGCTAPFAKEIPGPMILKILAGFKSPILIIWVGDIKIIAPSTDMRKRDKREFTAPSAMVDLRAFAPFSNPPPSKITFALFTMGFFFILTGLYAPFFYVPIYPERIGVCPDFAPYLLAIINAGSFVGRVLPPLVAHRLGAYNTLLPCLFMTGIIGFAWMSVRSVASIVMFSIFYGFFLRCRSGATTDRHRGIVT